MTAEDVDLKAMRHRLRRWRRQRRPLQRRLAARSVSRALAALTRGRRGLRIAGFFPADGELDVRPAMLAARRRGARLYLPVVGRPGDALEFRRWRPGARLTGNRFGIPEPPPTAPVCPATRLHLVLMPLVAFDIQGRRLGMGGGFYDRTFGACRHASRWRRPQLVGVAFAGQRVGALPRRAWDVPLDVVITERGLVSTDDTKAWEGPSA